jgi:hypothetical protein
MFTSHRPSALEASKQTNTSEKPRILRYWALELTRVPLCPVVNQALHAILKERSQDRIYIYAHIIMVLA